MNNSVTALHLREIIMSSKCCTVSQYKLQNRKTQSQESNIFSEQVLCIHTATCKHYQTINKNNNKQTNKQTSKTTTTIINETKTTSKQQRNTCLTEATSLINYVPHQDRTFDNPIALCLAFVSQKWDSAARGQKHPIGSL